MTGDDATPELEQKDNCSSGDDGQLLPSGLTGDGLNVLQNAKSNGVRIDVVNVMAMDYGDWAAPNPEGQMGQYAIDSANSTHSQIQGIGVNADIGVTPKIGQNDVQSERFYVYSF